MRAGKGPKGCICPALEFRTRSTDKNTTVVAIMEKAHNNEFRQHALCKTVLRLAYWDKSSAMQENSLMKLLSELM